MSLENSGWSSLDSIGFRVWATDKVAGLLMEWRSGVDPRWASPLRPVLAIATGSDLPACLTRGRSTPRREHAERRGLEVLSFGVGLVASHMGH